MTVQVLPLKLVLTLLPAVVTIAPAVTVPVLRPAGSVRLNWMPATYRVELGYYEQSGAWRSVAISDVVTMPPESASENAVVDVATVPFHLSFQHMIDVFRESNGDELTTAISRWQDRAIAQDTAQVSAEEREVLRAMNLSIEGIGTARRAFMQRSDDAIVRKRAEAILGFGSTSPACGFGGSSWR